MKMFGLFEELQRIIFRKSGQTITVEPATQTGSPTINIPDTGSSATRVMVLADLAQTLTNKTLIADSTIFADLADTTKQIKFDAAGTTGTSSTLLSSQTANRILTLPDATDTLVGKNTTDILTNKTLGNTNAVTLLDTAFTLQDNGDITKQVVFQLSGITAGNTRVFTFPDASAILVGTDTVQTLTNKTINGANNTITNVSLSTGVTGTLPIANGGTGQVTQTEAFDALAPSTTKGDLIARTTSDNVRLPVGTNGQLLTADSSAASGVAWSSPVGTLPSIVAGDKYKNLRVNAAESGVEFHHDHITQDASPAGETVPVGYTLLYPWLTVGNGINYTIAGQLEVAQKLIISGTGAVIVSGSSRVF